MRHLSAAALALFSLSLLIGGAPKPESRVYAFAYLLLDKPEALSESEMNTAMGGHFSNMEVLAEEGKLLIAGPLAEPRIDDTYRGIYVFDVTDAEAGMKLFNTDPSVQAKVFKPEMYLIECSEPLLELPRLEKEDEAARLADPEIPDEWAGRFYVLAIAPGDAEFEITDKVLINATMTSTGVEPITQRLLFLDYEKADLANDEFEAADITEWSFYGWYGSKCVSKMATD